MMKSCSTEAMGLMKFEKFHFLAAKMPNRGSVDDRKLWVKGLKKNRIFRPPK
jgi:hypothetical protein